MKVIMLTKVELPVDGDIIYPTSECTHSHARSCHERLFADYNKKFNTNIPNFFWGFNYLPCWRISLSNGCIDSCDYKIGGGYNIAYLLDIPEDVCLETDFYNYSDQIYKNEFDNGEVTAEWESIYEKRNNVRQVIFPFIKKEWINDMKIFNKGD